MKSVGILEGVNQHRRPGHITQGRQHCWERTGRCPTHGCLHNPEVKAIPRSECVPHIFGSGFCGGERRNGHGARGRRPRAGRVLVSPGHPRPLHGNTERLGPVRRREPRSGRDEGILRCTMVKEPSVTFGSTPSPVVVIEIRCLLTCEPRPALWC